MDIFEVKQVLDTFFVCVDTREKPSKRAERRYNAFKAPYRREKLNYGDYTYNAVLPSGKPLFESDKPIDPLCAIERKFAIDELAQCFTSSRDRFRREFERARTAGARIYLLVEDGSWEHLINGKYRSKLHPNAFMASVTAYMVRYNMSLIFCKEETSGRLIREILYRDLKERLERGEFG